MTSNGEHAQNYARTGWRVFPVYEMRPEGECSCGGRDRCKPGKHPRVKNGFKAATDDSEQINKWWAQWPEANIGIWTGQASGLVVLDVDPRDGGEDSLEALVRKIGPLPPTVTALTGGGGLHLYFKHPGGKVNCRTGFRPGLDLKADGGYVIAPPSLHESGNRYTWKKEHGPGDVPLAELPEPLLGIISEDRKREGASSGPGALDPILEGSRDDTLTHHAGVFRAQGMEPTEYFPLLEEINQERCQPPLPATDVARIAWSVGRYPPGGNGGSGGSFPRTDLGNARRLIRARGQALKYVYNWDVWLCWDGTCWREDAQGQVDRWAKEVVEGIRKEARSSSDDRDRQDLLAWANASESRAKIEAMIHLAKSEEGIAIVSADLFADPWKLPVQNGTLDLKTGELRSHERGNMVTRALGVSYDPAARAPRWDAFLEEITDGNPGLAGYLRRAVGYSLTGTVMERCLFALVGDGANGKSTFLRALLGLFGPYGTQAEPTLLVASNWDQHPTGVADLQGMRLVVGVEVNTGKSFNHALVKQLTGGDIVKARRMRQDFFEFVPTHHFWLAMNTVPQIDPDDQAMWDRVRVIPFPVRFDPERQDKELLGKLEEEKEGILAWAVRGCREWREKGLQEPSAVSRTSAVVRAGMDPVGRFIKEECLAGSSASVEAGHLYEAFTAWCEREGEAGETQNSFGRTLTRRGYRRGKHPSGRVLYQGIGLRRELKDLNHSSTYTEPQEGLYKKKKNNGSDGSDGSEVER